MKKNFLFALLFIAFFAVSCTTTKPVSTTTNSADVNTDDFITASAIKVTTETPVTSTIRRFDIKIFGTTPSPYDTITVNQGETVELNFISKDPVFFSLDAYQINEYVRTGAIRFVAQKRGSFDMLCLNCDTSASDEKDATSTSNDKKNIVIGILNVR